MSLEQYCIQQTDFNFKNQQSVYHGKVRDVYDIGDKLIIITSDRISAFDYILPRPIPYKGQVLNQTASHFLNAVRDICPVWLESNPDPNVAVGKKCIPIPLEMVVRGYLAGHAWRMYSKGERYLCGVKMEEGLKEADKFLSPIITPSTKAIEGHDEDISIDDILQSKIVDKETLDKMLNYTLLLFERGSQMAQEKGLLLVDTKYEFGMYNGEVMLMDEIHTPDSSRYYISEGYQERQKNGEKQKQLSKEFVREWLMAHGFQGLEDQLMPEMSDDVVLRISERYIELYEKISGNTFQPGDPSVSIINRIQTNLKEYF